MDNLFSFYLGTSLFGLPAKRVIEVARNFSLTRVPGSPDFVSGLINLRGELVVAVNMRLRMALAASDDPDLSPMCVYVQTEHTTLGLLVDSVGEMFVLAADSLKPVPAQLNASLQKLVVGAYALPSQLLVLIDHEKILTDEQLTFSDIRLKLA